MQAVIKIIIVISNIFSNVLTPNMKYKITDVAITIIDIIANSFTKYFPAFSLPEIYELILSFVILNAKPIKFNPRPTNTTHIFLGTRKVNIAVAILSRRGIYSIGNNMDSTF